MSIRMAGLLRKMAAHATLRPSGTLHDVSYDLRLDEQRQPLTPWLGQRIELAFSGRIFCCNCGRQTRQSFSQGYCYPCFSKLAACDRCMMSPELCHFAQGTCREPQWAEEVCFRPHFVYLANSSGIKVGITREGQVPLRWLDQGAVQGMCIARVSSRRLSGLIESRLRQHVPDKTNWRTMLKGQNPDLDLGEAARPLVAFIQETGVDDRDGTGIEWLLPKPQQFEYPVLQYPVKVASLNPEKTPVVSGRLLGIKGQYLILDSGVINLRKYNSYELSVALHDD